MLPLKSCLRSINCCSSERSLINLNSRGIMLYISILDSGSLIYSLLGGCLGPQQSDTQKLRRQCRHFQSDRLFIRVLLQKDNDPAAFDIGNRERSALKGLSINGITEHISIAFKENRKMQLPIAKTAFGDRDYVRQL